MDPKLFTLVALPLLIVLIFHHGYLIHKSQNESFANNIRIQVAQNLWKVPLSS